MREVVDASGAATPVGLLHLDQLDAGDHLENLPGLLQHSLAVRKVAWVLVGDLQAYRSRRRPQSLVDQELRSVLDGSREGGARLLPLRIAAQLKLVLLHVRAAARGVDDHRVQLLSGK